MSWWTDLRNRFGQAQNPDAAMTHFKEELALRAARLEGVARVEQQPDDFVIDVFKDGADKPFRIFLDNLFAETRQLAPELRPAAYDGFLTRLLDDRGVSSDWDEAREQILPVIRCDDFGGGVDLPNMPRQPLLPGLAVFLVLDSEDSMAYVTDEQLATWGVDFATAGDTALARLQCCEHLLEKYGGPADSLWHLANDDQYDSSRVLLPAWREAIERKLGEKLVYAFPERSALLFAPLRDEAALARLHEVAIREFAAATRALSPDLYVEDEAGELGPLSLPERHPLHRELLRTRILFLGGACP